MRQRGAPGPPSLQLPTTLLMARARSPVSWPPNIYQLYTGRLYTGELVCGLFLLCGRKECCVGHRPRGGTVQSRHTFL